MPNFDTLLGTAGVSWATWLLALLVVLVLIVVVLRVLRALLGSSLNTGERAGARGRAPRLGVTEYFNLDRQGRRLVILRRDNVEHLVLIGGPNDVLVEANIMRGERATPRVDLRESLQLPEVETMPRPEPVRPEPSRAPEPAAIAFDEPGPERRPLPRPDETTSRLESQQPTPPPLPAFVQPSLPRQPAPPPAPSPRELPRDLSPPDLPPPSEPRRAPAARNEAVASEMAQRLEEVLRRPLANLQPSKSLAPPPSEARNLAPETPPGDIEPPRAQPPAMAAPPALASAPPPPLPPRPAPAFAPPPQPAAPAQPSQSATVAPAPPRPQPTPPPATASPALPPPQPPLPPPALLAAAPPTAGPFDSLEEEMARLLGREKP